MIEVIVERHRIARAWSEFQERTPLVLSPVWTEAAFPHGRDTESAAAAMDTLTLIRCVLPANLLGLPAAVVPAASATVCRSACRSPARASARTSASMPPRRSRPRSARARRCDPVSA